MEAPHRSTVRMPISHFRNPLSLLFKTTDTRNNRVVKDAVMTRFIWKKSDMVQDSA